MKEYKIKLVQCSYDRAVTETPEPDTLIGKVKDFFSPVELPVDPSIPNGGLLTGEISRVQNSLGLQLGDQVELGRKGCDPAVELLDCRLPAL